MTYALIVSAALGGILLFLLAVASANTSLFAQHYPLLLILNGVIAVPIMAVMMLLAGRRDTMGENVIGSRLRWLGWIATAAMALTVAATFLTR